MGLSVVIPAYNERWRLSPTLVDLVDFGKKHPGIINEVVIVDDGSTDRTVERVLMYKNKLPITLVQHKVNQGKWAAIRSGIEKACQSHILILDADGSASIRELERLGVDYIKNYVLQNDVALFGSRFQRESSVDGKTPFRRLISRVYRIYGRFMFRWATGKTAPDDLQCPFKIFPKKCLTGKLTAKQWVGDIELAAFLNCPIRDVPIRFVHKGGSKIAKSTIISMALMTFQMAQSIRHRQRVKTST